MAPQRHVKRRRRHRREGDPIELIIYLALAFLILTGLAIWTELRFADVACCAAGAGVSQGRPAPAA